MTNHLFTLDPDTQEVTLNKEWIHLIPEFAALLKRDKGSAGDYRGDKKLRARREFTYIYFTESFTSPLFDWDPPKKEEEALRYASLTSKEIDEDVTTARLFYRQFIRECSPSLATLDALYAGRTELNRYFKEVNFKETDKLGKSKYTAKEYISNIKDLPAMNEAIKKYEKQVDEELRESTGIRGKNVLGLMEGQRKKVWEESGPPEDDPYSNAREIVNFE